MQRLEVKKPNEIHQKNFPWQYFVVVYETPNCDFFFLFSEKYSLRAKNEIEWKPFKPSTEEFILCHNA